MKQPTTTELFEIGVRRGQEVIAAKRGIPTYINGYSRVLRQR